MLAVLPIECALNATGLPAELTPQAAVYALILALTFPGTFFLVGIRGLLQAFGHLKIITVIALLGLPMNAGLNYALGFGHWGFPNLGIKGIAWATVIVDGVSVILALLYLGRFILAACKFSGTLSSYICGVYHTCRRWCICSVRESPSGF